VITLTKQEAQQVLEALENFCGYGAILKPLEVRDLLRARLAQPEPEPVAGYRWEEGRTPPSVTFAAAPQREWQGLTDEEIMDACAAVWASHPIEVGHVVQDLLKEKNT